MLSKLREMMENNQIEQAISLIKEIGVSKNIDAVPYLIDYLKIADNHSLRNQIALALSDIGNPAAVEPIIELLRHPKTLGSRGSLLYALRQFDCSRYIDLLVDMVCHGNFEVRRESSVLLEGITSEIPSTVLLNCIKKVNCEIDELEDKINILYKAQDTLLSMDHK